MSDVPTLTIAVGCAVAYLLAAYALGGPLVLVRTLVQALSQRRLRYRARATDDVLASSRFTIPVSVILPTQGAGGGVADAVQHLLDLNYPEFEVVVVNDGDPAVLDELRERFTLSACEVFYRRTLKTSPVGSIFRSPLHERLLVVECRGEVRADALNCGVNLSRYRYVCCADVQARYAPNALLDAMHAAVEDPGLVVGISTSLGLVAGAAAGGPPVGLADALLRLSALRSILSRSLRRRLSLSPDSLQGFSIWRRDVIVDTGGFSLEVPAEQIEMTFRVHRHMLRARQEYRMVHVATPVGAPLAGSSMAALVSRRLERQQSVARVLWMYRVLLFNPRYRQIGVVDLPRYLFAALVVPWLELLCLLALPFSVAAGVLSLRELVLAFWAIGLGNGILLNAAMLAAPWPRDERTLLRLLLLGPVEVFVSRPVQLYSRMVGLLRILFSRPAPAGA